MDAFGDIITFLLIIAFSVIFPIIGAVSKNKAKKARSLSNTSNEQSFNDVISSFSSDIEELRRKKAEAFGRREFAPEYAGYTEGMTEDVHVEEVIKPLEKVDKQEVNRVEELRESFKQNVNTDGSARSIANSFDIKKAVIYSEILDTKYF